MAYGGSLHINQALSNISVKYTNNEFIAGQILKEVPVKKESDVYYIYNRDFKIPETLRADRSPASMHSWSVSTSTYNLNEHALADIVTDRERRNMDSPLQADIDTVENLTDKIMLRQEYEVSKLLFTTTSWGNNETIVTATSWDYAAGTATSLPIQDMLSATSSILMRGGIRPNTLVLGWDTFVVLKENQNVYDRIKYVERALITPELLASVFDVEKVFVGTAVYDSAADGITESMGYVWGPNALLCYINPSMGLKKVTAATMLRITEAGKPYKVKKWRREELSGDQVEVSTMFEPVVVASNCGFFFKDCNES